MTGMPVSDRDRHSEGHGQWPSLSLRVNTVRLRRWHRGSLTDAGVGGSLPSHGSRSRDETARAAGGLEFTDGSSSKSVVTVTVTVLNLHSPRLSLRVSPAGPAAAAAGIRHPSPWH